MAKWIKRWYILSSNGIDYYTVAQAEDGSWGCSCPAWKFRRLECKHIKAVKVNPDAYLDQKPALTTENKYPFHKAQDKKSIKNIRSKRKPKRRGRIIRI